MEIFPKSPSEIRNSSMNSLRKLYFKMQQGKLMVLKLAADSLDQFSHGKSTLLNFSFS